MYQGMTLLLGEFIVLLDTESESACLINFEHVVDLVKADCTVCCDSRNRFGYHFLYLTIMS